jgi:hypothetical protein
MALRNKPTFALGIVVAMLGACSSPTERSATSGALNETTAGQALRSDADNAAPVDGDAAELEPGSSGLVLYRAAALPPGAVIDAIGLAGRLSIGADCVIVIEQGGRKVVPIFPLDATRRLSPSSIELFGKAYRDGDDFNASVVAAMRDFTGGAGLQPSERAVAPGCIGDAYLKVVG